MVSFISKASRPSQRATGRRACRSLLTSSAAFLLGLAPLAASAQDSAPPQDSASQAGLGEITVTAQKRAENIQEVPISISAFTADTIRALNITSISEIANYTPNLQYTTGASAMANATNFFIRGIGQDDFITTLEPGVGVYVDGIYMARVTGASLSMGEVQRVEVLRGPQGTLFGRNTIGGAVNIVTADPSFELGGRASVTAGNLGKLDAQLDASIPLIDDKLAASISFLSHNTTGWGRNIFADAVGDRDLGRESEIATRGKLLFKPANRLKLLASFDYTRTRGTIVPQGLIDFQPTTSSAAYNATAAIPVGGQYVTRDPDKIQIDENPDTHMTTYGGSLTATWEGNYVNVKSITAYRHQSGLTAGDYDATPAPYLQQQVTLRQSQLSQELQVYGGAPTDRFKWLAGAYYFWEKGLFLSHIALSANPYFIDTGNHTNSYAVFGQATYRLTDKLSVTAGGRYTHDRKTIDVGTTQGATIIVPMTHNAAGFSNFSPMGTIEYQATPDFMAYAKISRGFRSGGFNGRPFALSALVAFDPETVTSYEGGFKSEWFDRKLQINAAGFHVDYNNLQMSATTHDAAGNFVDIVGNAARAKISGMELEVEALPVAGLHLYGSFGLTLNDLKEKPDFTFGATRLPDASKINYTFGADYKMPLSGWGSATLSGDYSYRSGFYPQFTETAPSYIHGYGLINARLAFEPAGARWSLTLYSKNLANKHYLIYGETIGTGDDTVGFFGRPREFGVSFGFRF